jgi:uncharacterized Zn finger protein
MPSQRRTERSGPPPDGWWPPASKPIPVQGGLKALSQRGQIGDSWWSRRFIEVLESFDIGGRLARGKRYARTGQVRSMDLLPGRVSASVQGSRAAPYQVAIETEVLTAPEWQGIESVMASSAVFLATLLSGEMPAEIEEAFVASSKTLFPASARDLTSSCTCPDWENPCKHVAAVYYLLAEAFDADPFLIFAWRGRSKEELLTDLRALRRGSGRTETSPGSPSGESSDDGKFGWPASDDASLAVTRSSEARSFWGGGDDVSAIEARPRLAVSPDLVLRQLDPGALAEDGGIIEALSPLYEKITSRAIASAFDDEAPSEQS